MSIKLMADSTCDLSQEIIDKYNISVAPLIVNIDGKEFRDKIDIQTDEFYNKLETYKNPPTTSMPSPDSYIKCILEAEENEFTEILCICMSSGTSGSYQGAIIAKDLYFTKYPESKITFEVIDSVSMSHGSGWLTMKCAMLLQKGYSFQQLIEYCEAVKYRIKHLLSVDDLENLIRSGRIGGTSAIIGKVLNIKPIMSMKNTKGTVIAKKRGHKQVLAYYIEEFIKRVDYEQTNFVIIGYTSDIHRAENLKIKFQNETQFKGEVYIMQMGVAVGTHVGLGGLSMFFVEKPHEDFIQHVKDIILHQIKM
jgi:DegV family protein with EDD domain